MPTCFKSSARPIAICFLTLIVGMLGYTSSTVAQTSIAPNLPKSPAATALTEFIEVPVGHYTGTVDVTIPLWSHREGTLQSSATLNYRTGGVKVNAVASAAGLGWNIATAPTITRIVHGLPDELSSQNYDLDIRGFLELREGYSYQDIRNFQFDNSNLYSEHNSLYDKLAYGCYDAEPDEFYFRVGPYSGTFMYDWSAGSDPVVISDSPVRVTSLGSAGLTWEIVTPDGNVYTFDAGGIELTTTYSDVTNIGCSLITSRLAGVPTTWHCTKATDVNDKVDIIYMYNDYNYQQAWIGSPVRTQSVSGNVDHSGCPGTPTGSVSGGTTSVQVFGKLPRRTTFSSGQYIEFVYSDQERQDNDDLMTTSEFVALDEVRIGYKTRIKRTVHLDHDYSTGRLTLKKVRQTGHDGTEIAPYEFTYYNGTIPSISSKAIDLYGYYNGKNNSTLIPKKIGYHPGTNTPYLIDGGDRKPYIAAQTASLASVTTPTRAVTDFEYELNSYSHIMGRAVVNLEEQELVSRSHAASVVNHDKPAEYRERRTPFTLAHSTTVTFKVTGSAPRTCFYRTTQAYIVDSDGNELSRVLVQSTDENETNLINLPEGEYEIVTKATTCNHGSNVNNTQTVRATVIYDELISEIVKQKATGGLRILRKTVNPGADQPAIEYNYSYEGTESGTTSGVIYAEPDLEYEQNVHLWENSASPTGASYRGTCKVRQLHGRTTYQLAQTKGSHIGYSKVTEYVKDKSKHGYTEYTFTSPKEQQDLINMRSPFGAPQSKNYRTGLPLTVTYFSSIGNDRRKIVYTYQHNETEMDRIKIGFSAQLGLNYNDHNYATFYNVTGNGDVYTRWFRPYTGGFSKIETITTTDFFPEGEVITTTTNDYSNDGQYLKAVTKNSSGHDFQKVEYIYPIDEDRQCLVAKNLTATPVEKRSVDKYGNVLSAHRIYFGQIVNGKPYEGQPCDATKGIVQSRMAHWDTENNEWVTDQEILTVNDDALPIRYKRRKLGLPEELIYEGRKITSHAILLNGERTQEQTWEYKDNSELVEKHTAIDDKVVEYLYDDLDRLQTIYHYGKKVKTEFEYSYAASNDYNYVHTTVTYGHTDSSRLEEVNTVEYFDGMGRAIQTVKKAHGQNREDIVSWNVYDDAGKLAEVYEMLPHNPSSYYYLYLDGSTPTRSFTYLKSPLNRLYTISEPAIGRHERIYYGANSHEVTLPNGTEYQPLTLFCVSARDYGFSFPGDLLSRQYTDRANNTIINEREHGYGFEITKSSTYYAYDGLNRVRFVYPPVNSDESSPTVYETRYDGSNNVVYQKVPDRAPTHIIYDERDLPIFIQQPGLPTDYDYIATVYDDYGRPVETGFGAGILPDQMLPAIGSGNLLTTSTYGAEGIETGKITGGTLRLLEGGSLGNMLEFENTYEPIYGRLLSTVGNHHMNLTDHEAQITTYTYDLADNVVMEDYRHTLTDGTTFTSIRESIVDHAGRSVEHYLQLGYDNGLGPRTQTSQLTYTARDQVKTRSVGKTSTDWLQQTDFTYLANGFLERINNPSNIGEDLFALQINYHQTQHAFVTPRRDGNISGLTVRTATGQHFTCAFSYDALDQLLSSTYYDHVDPANNGRYNTSYIYDRRGNLERLERDGRYPTGDDSYGFGPIDELTYDYAPGTNKIKAISDAVGTPEAAATGYATHDGGDYGYHEPTGNMTFDPSRNLSIAYNYLNLPHTFTHGDGSSVSYLYTAEGTKLREINTDATGVTLSEYDYLGPVIYDDGIIQSVQHPDGRVIPSAGCVGDLHISGTVDGDETHCANSITTDATVTSTGGLTLIGEEGVTLQKNFAVAAGGTFTAQHEGLQVGQWQFEYFLTDHLGNNRILFADVDGNGSIDPAMEVLQESHYYAFGLEMEGAWSERNPGAEQRYRYNGMEINEELGQYDYGARWYDPATARFTTIDPHASSYPSLSPYNYVGNNPISFIDPTGMDLVFYLANKSDDEKKQAFNQLLSVLSSTLDGDNFSLTSTKDGGFSLGVSGGSDKDYAIHAEHYLSQVIDDDFTTKIDVTTNDFDTQVGSYDRQTIDVSDILQFPANKGIGNNKIGTISGKFIHEVYEQYDKQKNGRANTSQGRDGYDISHGLGKTAEAGVDGLMRVPFSNPANKYIYPDYAKKIPRNATGRRTQYYNPATGQTHIEGALFYNGGLEYPLGTLRILPPKRR